MKTVSIESRLASIDPAVAELLREMAEVINANAAHDAEGFGSPEGVRPGRKGMRFRRLDGGAGTCLYVFEGVNGAVTGWVAK